jgi:hypothetical protein
MRYLLLLAFLLAAHAAAADDFSARAAAGRAAAGTPEGTKYDQSMWPILTQAGHACDPPGAKVPASELGHFDIVGNITNTGKMVAIEATPINPLSECYLLQLSHAQFAPPPPSPRPSYPIVIDLTVTP